MKNRFNDEEIQTIEEMADNEHAALLELIASIKQARNCKDERIAVCFLSPSS